MNATHQDPRHKTHFKDGRHHVEHKSRHHKVDASAAPVNGLGQRPSLPAQVEVEVKAVQVKEHILGNLADGVLGHLGEDGVAQLIEGCRSCTSNAICQHTARSMEQL